MKPTLEKTAFGSITIDGRVLEHDVVIRLDGRAEKRKKKLSKAVYGTSHVISVEEARHVFEKGAELLILGSGQEGMVRLSEEAADYLRRKKCRVIIAPTPEAVREWNRWEGPAIGLFHVTC